MTGVRTACALALLATSLVGQASTTRDPFRLEQLFAEDSWFRLSGSFRARWEGIDGQFRTSPRLDNVDHLGFLRTILRADADLELANATVEIMDSRHLGAGTGSGVNTSNVNALDVLQAFLEVKVDGAGTIRAGRRTLDLGSRRLVARNRYRNTINSFMGVDWEWKTEEDHVRVFWYLPTRRLPARLNKVLDNDLDWDDQDLDFQFFGGFYQKNLSDRDIVEVYVFLMNDDRPLMGEREFATPGFRVLRKPKRGAVDYQLEAAYQIGESRRTAAGPDLDHHAYFAHASTAFTFDETWRPRLRFALDYASGDKDPTDGDNGTFDTLFGARRFEYGPTGIYGAIARSNLLSPEVRVELRPAENVNWMLAWRGAWLASEQDGWGAARLADATGASGRHVGQQFETRLRWDIEPKSVRLEAGVALLLDGSFQKNATMGRSADTYYGYAQMAWTF